LQITENTNIDGLKEEMNDPTVKKHKFTALRRCSFAEIWTPIINVQYFFICLFSDIFTLLTFEIK